MGGRKSEKISALKPFIGKQAKIFAAALTGTLFAVQSLGAIVNLRGPAPENYVWVAAHRADWHHAPENSKTFRLLPQVLDSGTKSGESKKETRSLCPAVWSAQGFSLIETNFPRELVS